jgi:hypothetical protein
MKRDSRLRLSGPDCVWKRDRVFQHGELEKMKKVKLRQRCSVVETVEPDSNHQNEHRGPGVKVLHPPSGAEAGRLARICWT